MCIIFIEIKINFDYFVTLIIFFFLFLFPIPHSFFVSFFDVAFHQNRNSIEFSLQQYLNQPVWSYSPKEISVVLSAMSKIGMNWDTLKFRTRKLLVIVISKTFRRFSPALMIQTLTSLNDMKCLFNDIEIMGKEIQIELNEKNNNELEILKVLQNVQSNQDLKEFENKNNQNESQNVEKITMKNNNENQQQQQEILLTPKKRKLPLFSAFTKNDLFDLISNFVLDGQFNNWEMINLLTYVTDLGTILHEMKIA